MELRRTTNLDGCAGVYALLQRDGHEIAQRSYRSRLPLETMGHQMAALIALDSLHMVGVLLRYGYPNLDPAIMRWPCDVS